jgi:hypothetical protein
MGAGIDPQRDDGFDLTCGVVVGADDELGCITYGTRRERHGRDDQRHQHGFARQIKPPNAIPDTCSNKTTIALLSLSF